MKRFLIALLVPAYVVELVTTTKKRNHDTCNISLPWNVSRKDYRDIPDFVFSTLMQCPAELHGCSQNLVSCGRGEQKITCSCASNCKAYRDCCWNVEISDETSKPAMSASACVRLRVDYGVRKYVYMIVGCPPTWPREDVKLACEQLNSVNGTFYSIPVTSINHITYRNGFCALCNDDLVNATFWNATTFGTRQRVFVGIPYITLKQPALLLRPCVANVLFDTCPQGSSAALRRKCKTYYAPVQDDLGIPVYRNVYCAICNGANLSKLSCSPAFHSQLLSTSRKKMSKWFFRTHIPVLPAHLFRPVRTTPTCYAEHNEHCYIKNRPVVFSPVSRPAGGPASNETASSPFTPSAPEKIHFGLYDLHVHVTVVSMLLSICCLLLKIIVFCACKEARSFWSQCTICLSVTLLLTQLMFLTTSCFALAPALCVACAVIAHYGFLSTMTWTTALSYDIWRNVTSFQHLAGHGRALFVYGAICWGFPAGVVACAAAIDQIAPGSQLAPGYGVVPCWLGKREGLIAYIVVPFTVLLFSCVVFYVKTVCYIRRTSSAARSRSRDDIVRTREYRNNLTLFVRLAIIMGAVWVLLFLGAFIANVVVDLLIDTLVGLEGVYLFFAFRDYRYFCCASGLNQGKKTPLSGFRTASRSNISNSKKL